MDNNQKAFEQWYQDERIKYAADKDMLRALRRNSYGMKEGWNAAIAYMQPQVDMMVKANEALRESAGWLDIESAPKDGTLILTCHKDYYHPIAACWANFHVNASGKECWRTARTCGNKVAATHWMPLPLPPK